MDFLGRMTGALNSGMVTISFAHGTTAPRRHFNVRLEMSNSHGTIGLNPE